MTDGAEPICELLAALESLFREQLAAAQQGDLNRLEQLSEKTSVMITEIGRDPMLREPQLKRRYQEILNLSRQLELTITANAGVIDQQLRKLNAGKKTVQAYRRGS